MPSTLKRKWKELRAKFERRPPNVTTATYSSNGTARSSSATCSDAHQSAHHRPVKPLGMSEATARLHPTRPNTILLWRRNAICEGMHSIQVPSSDYTSFTSNDENLRDQPPRSFIIDSGLDGGLIRSSGIPNIESSTPGPTPHDWLAFAQAKSDCSRPSSVDDIQSLNSLSPRTKSHAEPKPENQSDSTSFIEYSSTLSSSLTPSRTSSFHTANSDLNEEDPQAPRQAQEIPLPFPPSDQRLVHIWRRRGRLSPQEITVEEWMAFAQDTSISSSSPGSNIRLVDLSRESTALRSSASDDSSVARLDKAREETSSNEEVRKKTLKGEAEVQHHIGRSTTRPANDHAINPVQAFYDGVPPPTLAWTFTPLADTIDTRSRALFIAAEDKHRKEERAVLEGTGTSEAYEVMNSRAEVGWMKQLGKCRQRK